MTDNNHPAQMPSKNIIIDTPEALGFDLDQVLDWGLAWALPIVVLALHSTEPSWVIDANPDAYHHHIFLPLLSETLAANGLPEGATWRDVPRAVVTAEELAA
jgi:hypothetical protein